MHKMQNRRDHHRLPGQVLMVTIGIKPYALIDISIGGVAFESGNCEAGDVVRLKIVSVLDSYDYVEADCEVVRVEGLKVSARFVNPPASVLEFVTTYSQQWQDA